MCCFEIMGSVPPHSRNLLFFLLASCILFQPFASASNSNEAAWLSVDASQGSARKIPQTLFGVFFEVNLTLLSPFWYTRIIPILFYLFFPPFVHYFYFLSFPTCVPCWPPYQAHVSFFQEKKKLHFCFYYFGLHQYFHNLI